MINPHTRFTFFHATVSPTGTVVNQPVGWRDASLSLVRDPKGHSLVEFFKNSFEHIDSINEYGFLSIYFGIFQNKIIYVF